MSDYQRELEQTYQLIEDGAAKFEEAAKKNACVLCRNDLLTLAKAGREEIQLMKRSEEYTNLRNLQNLSDKVSAQVKEGTEMVEELKKGERGPEGGGRGFRLRGILQNRPRILGRGTSSTSATTTTTSTKSDRGPGILDSFIDVPVRYRFRFLAGRGERD